MASSTANILRMNFELTPYLISSQSILKKKVWIVLPAFNEAKNLGKLIDSIVATMGRLQLTYEIVAVDDGSRDQTLEVIRRYQPHLPVTAVVHSTNQGLGATMRDGFYYVSQKAAPQDVVIAMDADNTHNPGLMGSMLQSIEEGSDVVIASRYQNGSVIRGVPSFRQWLSLMASYLFRICFPVTGVKDYTCGYRAYRVDLIQSAFKKYGDSFINQNGFECMVDILIKLRKLEAIFREVPLVLRYDLKEGESKMRVARTIFRSLTLIAKHRLKLGVAV
ncbi:MAG: glycosyltransferase family 2 protein [Deltaproteobacteria bacterium]|nr:glycosyltransferase family 2 protein [Deltaproteobacteria bacterium]